MSERFITLWRKPDNPLDWDFYVSNSAHELAQAVDNLKRSGSAKDFTTYRLGERVPEHSRDFVKDTPTPEASS